MPETITTADPDRDRGLYQKFAVSRTSPEAEARHQGCEYFVLDITHDRHASAALAAYADSCRAEFPTLAADLNAKSGRPDAEPARTSEEAERWQVSMALDASRALGHPDADIPEDLSGWWASLICEIGDLLRANAARTNPTEEQVRHIWHEVLERWGTAPSGRRTMTPATALGITKTVLALLPQRAPGLLRWKFDHGRTAVLDQDSQIVGYLSEPPERCAPSQEEIAKVIEAHQDAGSDTCSCGFYAMDVREHRAGAIQKLFAAQPTVEEVWREAAATFHSTPAIRDVANERATHERRGWTAEHDTEHGPLHLIELAGDRVNDASVWQKTYPGSDPLTISRYVRSQLVKAASLLVAAIELLDRSEADHG